MGAQKELTSNIKNKGNGSHRIHSKESQPPRPN